MQTGWLNVMMMPAYSHAFKTCSPLKLLQQVGAPLHAIVYNDP